MKIVRFIVLKFFFLFFISVFFHQFINEAAADRRFRTERHPSQERREYNSNTANFDERARFQAQQRKRYSNLRRNRQLMEEALRCRSSEGCRRGEKFRNERNL